MRRIVLFLLLAMQGSALEAQQSDSVSASQILERAKRGNWFLRVRTDTALVQGRVTFLHRDTAASFGRQRVRFNDVSQIERRTRQGSAAGPAAIGGGLLLGGFFMLWGAGLCEGDCDSAVLIGAAAGFTLGGAVGALLGTAISPGRVHWATLWPDSIARAANAPMEGMGRSGTSVTAQVGLLLVDGDGYTPTPLPTFFSLHISRVHGVIEFTPLGFTAAFGKNNEAGFVAFESGINYHLRSPVYVGATAGVATAPEHRPVVGLRLGVAQLATSPFRLELRVNSPVDKGLHPSAHAVFGYSIRPWSARR